MTYTKKFRHELKYIINEMDIVILRNRLKHLMQLDSNTDNSGRYIIGSIYFDDWRDSAFYEKIDGVNERSKFRIRAYNQDDRYIVLEKKLKHNGMTQKISTELSLEQFNSIMSGCVDFLSDSKDQLLRDFYNKVIFNRLKPCQFVEYTREPYIYLTGNVRITFDMNIQSTTTVNNVLFGSQKPTILVLKKGLHILEVKYDEFLPEHIRGIVQLNNTQLQACSKYVLCRLATENYN